eukprot:8614405-Alexandrium_andersonii.AAC.1
MDEALTQLVQQAEDLEWVMTEEGPKVRCKSTEYAMPARLLEVRKCVSLSGSLQRFGMARRPAERG